MTGHLTPTVFVRRITLSLNAPNIVGKADLHEVQMLTRRGNAAGNWRGFGRSPMPAQLTGRRLRSRFAPLGAGSRPAASTITAAVMAHDVDPLGLTAYRRRT